MNTPALLPNRERDMAQQSNSEQQKPPALSAAQTLEIAGRRLDKSFSRVTSQSGSRPSSATGSTQTRHPWFKAVNDFESILNAVRTPRVKEISSRRLQEISRIAQGENFTVVRSYCDNQVAVVKQIKQGLLDDVSDVPLLKRRIRSVLWEILVMHHGATTKHPNITHLIGFGWRNQPGDPDPYIVVEHGSLGCLRPLLLQSPLPLKHKLLLASDIASGLMSLHDSKVIHGDLKLDNVLLFPSQNRDCPCIAKLSDFTQSVSFSTNEDAVYYRGTALYLPPEALNQRENPIPLKQLHKCDIWAFGLALWEILLNGRTYFHDSWSSDIRYSRLSGAASIMSSSCASSTFDEISIHSSANSLDSPTSFEQPTFSQYFGNFDIRHLQNLAQDSLHELCPDQPWDRSYLASLLKMTLDPYPLSRTSDLRRSPILSLWSSIDPKTPMQADFSRHAGISDNDIDILQPEYKTQTDWEHQVSIVSDYKATVNNTYEGSHAASAAFQLMICQALGFGCEVDAKAAFQSLKRAIELDFKLTRPFGRSLVNALCPTIQAQNEPYEKMVACAFFMGIQLEKSSPLYLCTRPDSDDPSHRSDMSSTALASTSYLIKVAMTHTRFSKEDVLLETCLYSCAQQIRLSWLELAILIGNIRLFRSCIKVYPTSKLRSTGVWGDTPLILACRMGRSEMVRVLLKKGANYSLKSKGGCTMLHWLFCLTDKAVETLDLLVSSDSSRSVARRIDDICTTVYRVDPQWPTKLTGTPLAFAVAAGNRALASRLIHYGADPLVRFPDFYGSRSTVMEWTPLHLAIKYNFSGIVYDICNELHRNQRRNTTLSVFAFPKFQIAMALGFMTSVERYAVHGERSRDMLIETINSIPAEVMLWPSEAGMTALGQAIAFQNTEVVETLLSLHPQLARIEIRDPKCPEVWTLPFHYAVGICASQGSRVAINIPQKVQWACEEALSSTDSHGRSALHYAVTGRFSHVTEWLISTTDLLNQPDSSGRTPLMLSQSESNTRTLLDKGATLDRTDEHGMNSAHHAVASDQKDCLRLLMKRGIDLNQIAGARGSPLHMAVARGSRMYVEQLCNGGASVNARNSDEQTPLHIAVTSKQTDVVRILLRHGADPTISDKLGLKPTTIVIAQMNHYAAASNPDQLKVLETLFAGCTIPEKSQKQHDHLIGILHDCVRQGSGDLIRAFLSHSYVRNSSNIDVNSAQDGQTPLHLAAELGRTKVVEALLGLKANPNGLNSKGETPLLVLCASKCDETSKSEICNLLLVNNADPLIRNTQGQTAWSSAGMRSNFGLMAYILAKTSKSRVKKLLTGAPITWTHIRLSLIVGNTVFANECLRNYEHVQFLYDNNVMTDIAWALRCKRNPGSITRSLRAFLTYHSDLVVKALSGEQISNDMLKRQICIAKEDRGTEWETERKLRKYTPKQSQYWPAVTESIHDYLAKYEPGAVMRCQAQEVAQYNSRTSQSRSRRDNSATSTTNANTHSSTTSSISISIPELPTGVV